MADSNFWRLFFLSSFFRSEGAGSLKRNTIHDHNSSLLRLTLFWGEHGITSWLILSLSSSSILFKGAGVKYEEGKIRSKISPITPRVVFPRGREQDRHFHHFPYHLVISEDTLPSRGKGSGWMAGNAWLELCFVTPVRSLSPSLITGIHDFPFLVYFVFFTAWDQGGREAGGTQVDEGEPWLCSEAAVDPFLRPPMPVVYCSLFYYYFPFSSRTMESQGYGNRRDVKSYGYWSYRGTVVGVPVYESLGLSSSFFLLVSPADS